MHDWIARRAAATGVVAATARGCSALANWATGLKRSAGVLASARWSAAATSAGTAGRSWVIGGGFADQVLVHDALDRGPGEGRLSRQHLVEHAAEGVEIAPPIEVALAGGLFRAHVLHGADGHAGLGELARPRRH